MPARKSQRPAETLRVLYSRLNVLVRVPRHALSTRCLFHCSPKQALGCRRLQRLNRRRSGCQRGTQLPGPRAQMGLVGGKGTGQERPAAGWHTLRYSEGRAKPCNRLKPLAKSSAADHPIPGRPRDVVARAISNQLFPRSKIDSFHGQTGYSRVIPSAGGRLRHALGVPQGVPPDDSPGLPRFSIFSYHFSPCLRTHDCPTTNDFRFPPLASGNYSSVYLALDASRRWRPGSVYYPARSAKCS